MNAPRNSAQTPDERSAIDALRAITASLRDLPHLIRIVRSTYRAQDRKPQLEPAYVNWIERYVRFYQTKPLGLLDEAHVSAFLTHLARRPGVTPSDQKQALDALQFFHAEVLHDPLGTIDPYTPARRRHASPAPESSSSAGRTLWDAESS
jgi:hypothetical protein